MSSLIQTASISIASRVPYLQHATRCRASSTQQRTILVRDEAARCSSTHPPAHHSSSPTPGLTPTPTPPPPTLTRCSIGLNPQRREGTPPRTCRRRRRRCEAACASRRERRAPAKAGTLSVSYPYLCLFISVSFHGLARAGGSVGHLPRQAP